MVANANDGTNRAPYLRCDIDGGNLFDLPPESSGPKGEERAVLQAVKAAGFEGVQGASIALCRELGLGCTFSPRINEPAEADAHAATCADAGYDCVTLHVGWGIEDDDKVYALVDAVLTASERRGIPLYIETHRATITQDIWRTVQIVRRFPDVRFNGDFSHWYTGLEMVYGGFEAKVDFAAPVFERVRFIHGRIGNPGAIQVDIGDGSGRTYVDHFREMWTRSFAGFLRTAKPGDYICFTPELLHSQIYYARLIKNASGKLVEESDRWTQALLYVQIARGCFEEAKKKRA